MNATLAYPVTHRSNALRAIATGGALAGIGDITQALIVFGMLGIAPLRIWQSIAAGLLGRTAAFQGGWKTAVLGGVLHFLIATIWATVYYVASRKLPMLVEQPVIWGLLFGVVVFLFMYLVVQPLAGIHPKFAPVNVTRAVLVHIFCVGLPIAIVVRRYAFTGNPPARPA